jgi:hypothetical protein
LSLNEHCSSVAVQYRTCSNRREFPTHGHASWRETPLSCGVRA